MSDRFISSGRIASSAGGGTTTLNAVVESGGYWPKNGCLHTLMIRMTAGSATKYQWALYSEDPASPPAGTQAWEYLLCAAFDNTGLGGENDSVPPSADAARPDVFIEFEVPKAWKAKASAASVGNLWLVLTPNAGADNEWTAVIFAGPRRVRLTADEIPV